MRQLHLRWALAACLCLLLAAGAAAAPRGPFALNTNDGAVLVAADGKVLVESGVFDGIMRLRLHDLPPDSALFAAYATVDGAAKWTILNAQGEPLTGADYDDVSGFGDMVYVVKDGLTGVLNPSLDELVPCEYTQLVANGEGGFLALGSSVDDDGAAASPFDERPHGVYHVDAEAGETATGVKIRYGLTEFSEGLMPVVGVGGRMGYLNTRGEWAIDALYDYAGPFKGGIAEAGINTGVGVIDRQGNWLVTPKYAGVELGGNGRMVLVCEDNTSVLLLDPDTFAVKRRFTGEDIYASAYFDAELAVLYLDDATQLIDADGEVVCASGLDAGFDAWSAMGERLVVRQGAWGEENVMLCTLDGAPLAGPFRELWMLGELDGRVLFAAVHYAVREETSADDAYTDVVEEEGTRVVSVIDQDGNVCIEPRPYTRIVLDPSGAILFETPTQVGAMDENGEVIVTF